MTHQEAVEKLAARDPVLAAVIDEVGPWLPPLRRGGLSALLDIVISQQVSKRAAVSIRERVRALFNGGEITPAAVLALDEAELRGAGLSRGKAAYFRSIAQAAAEGLLDFGALETADDEAVLKALTQVKGIGRWTAEVYLLFILGRRDVFPAGDLALQNAVRELYGLPREGAAEAMGEICEGWRPFRGVAARYLYACINKRRGDLEPNIFERGDEPQGGAPGPDERAPG